MPVFFGGRSLICFSLDIHCTIPWEHPEIFCKNLDFPLRVHHFEMTNEVNHERRSLYSKQALYIKLKTRGIRPSWGLCASRFSVSEVKLCKPVHQN